MKTIKFKKENQTAVVKYNGNVFYISSEDLNITKTEFPNVQEATDYLRSLDYQIDEIRRA